MPSSENKKGEEEEGKGEREKEEEEKEEEDADGQRSFPRLVRMASSPVALSGL